MRAAALSRTVAAPPKTVAYRLTPERVVEAEGEFECSTSRQRMAELS